MTTNGIRRTAFVAADGLRRWVAFDSQPVVLTVPQSAKTTRRERVGGHESLEAQMPGMVRRVLVGVGERVARGQVLVLMEAMKMEIRVSAPHAGTVEKILVSEGQAVERGQALVELGA
jgi:biotin carboxyl carrier protein